MRVNRTLPILAASLLATCGSAFAQALPQHEEPGGVYSGDLHDDPVAAAALATLRAPSACAAGTAVGGTFACQSVDLMSFVRLADLVPGSRSASNLWGFVDLDDRREYAVIGVNNGTAVVDVTNPAQPRVVGSVAGPVSVWREVKVYQPWNAARQRHDAYVYVVSEATGAGLQIIDLSNLPASISLVSTFRGFNTAHTLFVANVDPASGEPNVPDVAPVLYIEGSDIGFLSLDVSRPDLPFITGRLIDSYVHDVWAGVFRGERAGPCAGGHPTCEIVVDWGGDSVRIIDFTTKSNPVVVAAFRYPELAYAHSGWISRDGRYLFSFDEGDELATGQNSRIRVLDISDLAHPSLAAVWTSSTKAIEHNGYIVGDKLYASYYERGMAILDVSNPTAPREIGFFDTFPSGDDAQFHGAWGIYPFLPSGTLLVSNIDGAGGLFVLREPTAAIAPPVDVPRNPVTPVTPRSRDTRQLPGSR
jgi:choice-of-anchor B domain-containing protein